MCGIVGANSNKNITKILIEGLKKLEYRGYDSAVFLVVFLISFEMRRFSTDVLQFLRSWISTLVSSDCQGLHFPDTLAWTPGTTPAS